MTFHPGSHLLNPDYLSSPDTPAQGSIGTWCGLPSGHPRRRKGARLRGLPSLRLLGELSLHLLHLRLHRGQLLVLRGQLLLLREHLLGQPHLLSGRALRLISRWGCLGGFRRGGRHHEAPVGRVAEPAVGARASIAVAAHLALALALRLPLLLLWPSPSRCARPAFRRPCLVDCLAMTTCSCSGSCSAASSARVGSAGAAAAAVGGSSTARAANPPPTVALLGWVILPLPLLLRAAPAAAPVVEAVFLTALPPGVVGTVQTMAVYLASASPVAAALTTEQNWGQMAPRILSPATVWRFFPSSHISSMPRSRSSYSSCRSAGV